MKVKKPIKRKWYDQREWSLAIGLGALILAYVVGSRSLDTGSWWEYSATLVLLVGGINRLIVAVRHHQLTHYE